MAPEKDFIRPYELMQAIQQGGVIVTGNLRLARSLIGQYDQYNRDNEKQIWQSASILPWSNWLQQIWEVCLLEGLIDTSLNVLSADQELQIWQHIVTDSKAGSGLLKPYATAKNIQSAWSLLYEWQVPLNDECVQGQYDAEVFWQWMASFRALCQQKRYLSGSERIAEILKLDRDKISPLLNRNKIYLVGFDELNPAQKTLLNHLQLDIQWGEFAPEYTDHSAHCIACHDKYDEMKTLGEWIRYKSEQQPGLKIGVIVPELAQQRQALVHQLDLCLTPSNLSPHQSQTQQAYNLSLGRPLSEYPLIRSAFLGLELMQFSLGSSLKSTTLEIETCSKWLRSPFYQGWEKEMHQRAILDRRIRQERLEQISIDKLLYYAAQKQQSYFCPIVHEGLKQSLAFKQSWPENDSCKQWAERFKELLKRLGWGDGRVLNSEEYQVSESWNKLLAKLAALDSVLTSISSNRAFNILQNMASEILFQPQSKNSPIQVMGLYEATGLHFDALWIMGMHDGVWPAKANPDSFIPLPLQRSLNMPHSSAKRELEVAKKITQRLLYSAREVIFSYPTMGEQNEELTRSPLLQHLNLVNAERLYSRSQLNWLDQVMASGQLQEVRDDPAPPALQAKVSGGSALFKYQATCPFRAFAEIRLQAKGFEKSEPGFDALQRGGLVHKALELAWQTIQTHQCLIQLMADEKLEGVIYDAIQQALLDIREQIQENLGVRFIQIEIERIKQQLMEWFQLEAQRAPFAVERLEQRLQSEINGVLVDIVVDRIDRLDDERLVLIDYKTGGVKPTQWFGERPEEPQLPLYSSVVDGPKAAVLFAQIKTADIGFKGIVAGQGLIPNLPPKYGDPLLKQAAERWDEILQAWMLSLQRLAAEFRQGKADVEPINPNTTCQYCALSSLCRIDELNHNLQLGYANSGAEHE